MSFPSSLKLLRAFVVLVSTLFVSGVWTVPSVVAAQNIILFIGDGMGPDHVKAGRLAAGAGDSQQPLTFEMLGYTGESVTTLPDGSITDSATAATALATGYQHPIQGTIGIDSTGAIRETILEKAKARGYVTGIVTTDTITGATPAAFGAHEESRYETAEIGQDYLANESDAGDAYHEASLPNVLMGGGFSTAYADQADDAQYQVITDALGLETLSGPLALGLFANTTFVAEYANPPSTQPSLAQMVIRSLELLSASGAPFVLVVESALIDKITAVAGIGPEVYELDLAVQSALAWLAANAQLDNTLVIVTADHETGGLVVNDDGTMVFTNGAGNHTTRNVPIYATWPAALQGQVLDNTETFFLMEDSLTWGQPPVLDALAVETSDSFARISWITSEPATSELRNSSDSSLIALDPARVVLHEMVLSGLAPATDYSISVSSTDLAGYTAVAPLAFTTAAPQPITTLVPDGSYWHFTTGTDLGTAWREPGYDDAAWPGGWAQLGYGDGDETTLLPDSPVYPCYYFRHTFQVADPAAFAELSLRLLRDDGAVVYLNGTEVARYNLPAGEITYNTWAATSAEYDWDPAATVPNLLVSGINVLAVEVHQSSSSSTDVSLDLELRATRSLGPPPSANPQDVTLSEDVPTPVTLSGSDPEDDPLTFRVTTAPAQGTLSGTPPNLVYIPNLNSYGSDSFAFVVNDGVQDSAPATVLLTINSLNEDPPSAPQYVTAIAGNGQVALAWSASLDPDPGSVVTYAVHRRLAGEPGYGEPIATGLTVTSWLDTGLDNGIEYTYFIRAADDTLLCADSIEVSAVPAEPDLTAYVLGPPTLKSGTVVGDYTLTQGADGASQVLTESSLGGKGMLDATYVLHTLADPGLITSLTLEAAITSATWDDPWKALIWNGTAWEDVTAVLIATGKFAAPNPQLYVDSAGDIRVAITDGAAIRKERLDSLSVDLLRACITAAPAPTAPPASPTDLAATTVSATVIQLAWTDPADNEQSYEVERSLDGTTWSRVAELPADSTAYEDSGLDAGTLYYYRVRACNALGCSAYCDPAWAQTATAPALEAPSNLVAKALPKQKISLTWADNSADETGFVVERSLDGAAFGAIATLGSNAVTYTDSKLTVGTVYHYRVLAVRGELVSPPSNTASATAK